MENKDKIILSDEELGDMHGYNAHDYSAKSLAAFFTKAYEVGAKLTDKEYLLEEILVANGVIIPEGNGYKEGRGAVISISQESQEWLRYSFIAHESWHGIFFLDEDFRNTTAAIYYTIDQKSLDFIVGFWNSQPNLNYDYLVSNLIKVKYTNDRMQAIINNYLLEQDEQTIAEFNEMQEWRKLSKTVAKDILSNVN